MNPTIAIRLATDDDARQVASLLHDFNTEFDTPTPGVDVLAPRLRALLAGSSTFAVLAVPERDSESPIGFALITLRPNVWFDGPVALVDELYVEPESRSRGTGAALMARVEQECRARSVEYVEINVDEGDVDARRFYERLGYSGVDPDTGEPALYYSRELKI
jgi:GNAT superfamily N-acetyltransferase